MKGLTIVIFVVLFLVLYAIMFLVGNLSWKSVCSGFASANQLAELKGKIDEQQRMLEEIKRELEELKNPRHE